MGRRARLRRNFKESVINGDTHEVERLIREGDFGLGPIGIDYLYVKDEYQNNILHHALLSDHPNIIGCLLEHLSNVGLSRDEIKAFVNEKNCQGSTPVSVLFAGLVHKINKRKSLTDLNAVHTAFRTLLEWGADVSAVDNRIACPLYYAAMVNNLKEETFDLLFKNTDADLICAPLSAGKSIRGWMSKYNGDILAKYQHMFEPSDKFSDEEPTLHRSFQ